MDSCIFCDYKNDEIGTILFESSHCYCIEIVDEILTGRCIIIPKEHRETVFDLTPDEWLETQNLMNNAKAYIDEKYHPSGYNLGWNSGRTAGQDVFHAHLHIIPRHSDEPLAGKGICYWIKQKENKRKM